jgi:response regulator RpfG family c-di-GMP phosphodiesterase
MSKTGPIILIDDDRDDKEIFEHVIKQLDILNKFICFDRTEKAMNYLSTTADQPFIIFCDINLPLQDGLEFKQSIDSNPVLRKKSIPFVFYSTSADQTYVNKAYMEMTIQGFFKKPLRIEEMKKNIRLILEYWLISHHPNSDL